MLCSMCGTAEGTLKITEGNLVRFGCERCTSLMVREKLITMITETAWDVVLSVPDVTPDGTYTPGSLYDKMQRLIHILGAFDDYESKWESM